jgi:hypothetical protein
MLLYLIPESPDAKRFPIANFCVVKQYDSAFTYLWQPRLEIMLHGLVAVVAIDMEDVDRIVSEFLDSRIKRRFQQCRK